MNKKEKQLNSEKNRLAVLLIAMVVGLIGLTWWWMAQPVKVVESEPSVKPVVIDDPEVNRPDPLSDPELLEQAAKEVYIAAGGHPMNPYEERQVLEVNVHRSDATWIRGNVGELNSQFSSIMIAEWTGSKWVVALAGTDKFYELLVLTPDSFMSKESKESFVKNR